MRMREKRGEKKRGRVMACRPKPHQLKKRRRETRGGKETEQKKKNCDNVCQSVERSSSVQCIGMCIRIQRMYSEKKGKKWNSNLPRWGRGQGKTREGPHSSTLLFPRHEFMQNETVHRESSRHFQIQAMPLID